MLLQKREEALVNLAITNPSVKVVEYASFDSTPIFPDRKLYFGIALFIGLLVPFVIIYINNLFQLFSNFYRLDGPPENEDSV